MGIIPVLDRSEHEEFLIWCVACGWSRPVPRNHSEIQVVWHDHFDQWGIDVRT
jgi:hypothetical protein